MVAEAPGGVIVSTVAPPPARAGAAGTMSAQPSLSSSGGRGISNSSYGTGMNSGHGNSDGGGGGGYGGDATGAELGGASATDATDDNSNFRKQVIVGAVSDGVR